MSPGEIARAVRLRLAAELRDDRAAVDALAGEIARLTIPAADARDDWMRALALAFQLERYYTAVEAMIGRALRQLDGDVPTGPASHLEILRGASVALDGGRPVIVSTESADDLRELLKFRHLARHGYEARPELPRLLELAAVVARVRPSLDQSLDALDGWLRKG